MAIYFQFFYSLFPLTCRLTRLDTRLWVKSTTVWSDAECSIYSWVQLECRQCVHFESHDVLLHFRFQSMSLFKLGSFLCCDRYLPAVVSSNWVNYSQSTKHLCARIETLDCARPAKCLLFSSTLSQRASFQTSSPAGWKQLQALLEVSSLLFATSSVPKHNGRHTNFKSIKLLAVVCSVVCSFWNNATFR